MKEYLIPASVIDIAEKIGSPSVSINEEYNYIERLRAIKSFCEGVINDYDKVDKKKPTKPGNSNKIRSYRNF